MRVVEEESVSLLPSRFVGLFLAVIRLGPYALTKKSLPYLKLLMSNDGRANVDGKKLNQWGGPECDVVGVGYKMTWFAGIYGLDSDTGSCRVRFGWDF